MKIARRQFLTGALALGALQLAGPIARRAWAQPRFSSTPFTLGVASGYPVPTGVVLWTRLRALDYDFLAGRHAVSTALRFTLSVPGVHTAIVGTKHPERWPANAALLEAGALPEKDIARIRARWSEVANASWVGQV